MKALLDRLNLTSVNAGACAGQDRWLSRSVRGFADIVQSDNG